GFDAAHTVVVCPAGNQGCPIRQYPAAFHTAGHPNVIGVGSISKQRTRSVFSNYGPWVACCTEGERVVSTFYDRWIGTTGEAEPLGYPNAGTHPTKDFTSGWAQWSGTSFAAPKVAAAIADKVAQTMTPPDAWKSLVADKETGLNMGYVIPGLPPR